MPNGVFFMLPILSDWPLSTRTAALLAVLLLTSVAGIRLARSLHVPRVVGYLVLGIVAHYALQLIAGGAQQLETALGDASAIIELIKSFTLGLILFTIGLEFDAAHLRAVSGHLWKLTATEIMIIFPLVFISTWAVCPQHSLFVAIVLAIAAIETAPAATLMVLRQYNAKGPVTDHILAMTGMNNIAVITLFYIAFLIFAELGPVHGGISAEHMNNGLLLGILLATIGSAVLGFLIGLLLSLVPTLFWLSSPSPSRSD
jgi:Kef-type K+ transport system membrane component KefB